MRTDRRTADNLLSNGKEETPDDVALHNQHVERQALIKQPSLLTGDSDRSDACMQVLGQKLVCTQPPIS